MSNDKQIDLVLYLAKVYHQLCKSSPFPNHILFVQMAAQQILINQFNFKTKHFLSEHNLDFKYKPLTVSPVVFEAINTPSWQRKIYRMPFSNQLRKLAQLIKSPNCQSLAAYLSDIPSIPQHIIQYFMRQGPSIISASDLSKAFLTDDWYQNVLQANYINLTKNPSYHTNDDRQLIAALGTIDCDISSLLALIDHHQWKIHQIIYVLDAAGVIASTCDLSPASLIPRGVLNQDGIDHLEQILKHIRMQPLIIESESYSHPITPLPATKVNPLNAPKQLSMSDAILYSRCAFRYFATKELKLAPYSDPYQEFSRQIGILIHEILAEHLTDDIETIKTVIQQQLNNISYFADQNLAMKNIICEHLATLIEELKSYESTRAPFNTIHREIPVTYQYRLITLKGRLDRVDLIEGNRRMVIDYKTGSQSLNWYQTSELSQLPLYAVIYPDKVDAVAILSLKPKQVRLQGHSNDAIEYSPLIPLSKLRKYYPTKDSWDKQLTWWKKQLHTALDNLQSGIITPQPKSQNCLHCHFKAICRYKMRDQLNVS